MGSDLPSHTRGLRRLAALALTVALGCGREAAPPAVARVEGWALTQERLADLLVLAQPFPLDDASVAGVVEQWVTMAALAQRVAGGADLLGGEAMEASLWLEIREATLEAERRARLRDVGDVSGPEAEAAFRADTFRLLAHVLRRTGPGASTAERALQRRTAQAVLDGLLAGGSWAEAVARSEDAETRASSGLLGLFRVQEVPPSLRAAAERLEPGQVSSVVESAEGFHVLYRPRFEDVRELFARLLSERRVAEADSAQSRLLLEGLERRTAPGALEAVRSLSSGEEPSPPEGLVTWQDGMLDAGVVRRHLRALPAEARGRLADASDEALSAFLDRLVVREVRLRQAEAKGLSPDETRLRSLAGMHREDAAAWTQAMGPAGVEAFSRQALDRYMEALVARRVEARPVPALLREWLLEPLDWSVDEDARRSATAAARRLIDAAAGAAS